MPLKCWICRQSPPSLIHLLRSPPLPVGRWLRCLLLPAAAAADYNPMTEEEDSNGACFSSLSDLDLESLTPNMTAANTLYTRP